MAFIQAAAPFGQREGNVLSADNAPPERHIVVDLLRKAAPVLGLKPAVIATLEAMLGCLAPKRSHHTVFASNATLSFRRSGVSDRTLRRHVVQLSECGLLTRNDSPNRKRYSRQNRADGKTLRFGFDLSPLFARLQELAQLAASAMQEQETLAYLRCKLRAAAQRSLALNPEDEQALDTLRLLRRKLSVPQCEALLSELSSVPDEGASDEPYVDCVSTRREMAETKKTSANDGQNVRHHQRSSKEDTEEERLLSVGELVAACPDAAQFSLAKIETVADVVTHARTLAPMVGIDQANYQAAQSRIGPMGAAVTVWLMIQLHNRIRKTGAYFRSLTSGRNSAGFDPFRVVRKLAARTAQISASG